MLDRHALSVRSAHSAARGFAAAVLVAGLALLAPAVASASAGQLDPTFNFGLGFAYFGVDLGGPDFDFVADVAIQTDGKIVGVGDTTITSDDSDFLVFRLLPNSNLDASFGVNGILRIPIDFVTGGRDNCAAVALQADGKILVGGWAEASTVFPDRDMVVVRLEADGSIDTSFGTNGRARVFFDIGGNRQDELSALLVQPDGKILLAGTVQDDVGTSRFGVARLDTSGTLDPTFDADGRATAILDANARDFLHGMALQSNGSILLAGEVGAFSGRFGMVRITSTGAIDFSFGGGTGVVSTPFYGNRDEAWGVAVDGSDRIVLVGHGETGIGDSQDVLVARYLPDGTLDTTFSGDGRATFDFGIFGAAHYARDVQVGADGKIYVAGSLHRAPDAQYSQDYDHFVMRLDDTGQLDPSYGAGGHTAIAYNTGVSRADYGYGLALDADGRQVVVGTVDRGATNVDSDIATARLTSDLHCIFADSFENDSTNRWSLTVD